MLPRRFSSPPVAIAAISPRTRALASMRVASQWLARETPPKFCERLVIDGRKITDIECRGAPPLEKLIQCPHHRGVELNPLVFMQLFNRSFVTNGLPVNPVRSHRFVCICDNDDSRAEGNLFTLQAVRVTRPVEVFVMMKYKRNQWPQRSRGLQDRGSVHRVPAHEFDLIAVEPRRFH